MSLFFNNSLKIINELNVKGGASADDETTKDDNDLPPEDDNTSDNNDLPPEDTDELPEDDEGADGGSSDDDSTDDGDMENFDDDKIKTLSDMEDTIFSSLSPEQKTIKVLELKGTFVTLFNSCDDILEKIELIPKDNGVIDTFEKITDTLIKLKTYIEFYLSKTFDTKSYLENEVVLQKYTTIFNAVKEVFKEISKRK